MTYKDKLFLWLIGIFTLCLFIYSVSSVLMPFIVAIIAAYFLDPTVTKAQKLGLSRNLATTLITVSFFLITIIITALLAPVFYTQFLTFLHTIPTYISYINDKIVPEFSSLVDKIDPSTLEKAKDSMGDASGYALRFFGTLATNLFNSGMAVINLFSLLFITPIVTFYMLRDWNKILSKINGWLPPKYAKVIREQAREIDHTLSGYIRGQTHVCLIIGAYYATTLTIAGLQFSLFIGFATGLLLFIPYVGTLFGFTLSMLVAFFQFGDMQHMGIIAGIFLVGQVLEGMFITPNMVGNKVGLHPVWIMFGLLAGGAMFGFVGVLVAVPVTAIIGVLARFFLGEYLRGNKKLESRS